MPFTVADAQERVQFWMLRTFQPDALHNFKDSEFLAILNQVARDMNSRVSLWIERYYKTTTDGETNYELQGKILQVLYFGYENYLWEDQYYSFVEDVIVLKESPAGDIQMDIRYLRDAENVALLTDEIDLPDHVISDFIDLVKIRLKVDFGVENEILYHEFLNAWAIKSAGKLHIKPLKTGTFRYWALPELGDDQYDITDNYVSQDSVVMDVEGDYHFIPDA